MLERPFCPECGGLLSMDTSWDKETGEFVVYLFCDGDYSDEFSFQIQTGLTQDIVDELWVVEEVKEMKMGLIVNVRHPVPDPDYDDE